MNISGGIRRTALAIALLAPWLAHLPAIAAEPGEDKEFYDFRAELTTGGGTSQLAVGDYWNVAGHQRHLMLLGQHFSLLQVNDGSTHTGLTYGVLAGYSYAAWRHWPTARFGLDRPFGGVDQYHMMATLAAGVHLQFPTSGYNARGASVMAFARRLYAGREASDQTAYGILLSFTEPTGLRP